MSKLGKVGGDMNILKLKTCVLKVNIHCEGCEKKVKKLLQKLDGVYSIAMDAEQGKVTVTGNVDSSTLIKKLKKSGKHGELCPFKKSSNFDPIDTAKEQKMQQLQKELMNLKIPLAKDQKSVQFSAPGHDFDDDFDEEDDFFDETDDSDDEIGDYKNPPIKGAVTGTKGFGGEANGKNSDHKQSNGGKNGSAGHFNRGMAAAAAAAPAAPAAGASVNPYQQQHVNEMMHGYAMASGYPMPASNAYSSYFSDENTGGSCRVM